MPDPMLAAAPSPSPAPARDALSLAAALGPDHPLRALMLDVTVALGRARPRLGDLLAGGTGMVLPLDRAADDPVELWIGDRLIARGELEELGPDGRLGVRLTEVAGVEAGIATGIGAGGPGAVT